MTRRVRLLSLRAALVALCSCAQPSQAWATELELVLRGGPFVPTDGEGGLAPVGVEGGAAAFLRFSDHFALGLMLDSAWIGWSARASADGIPATTRATQNDPGGEPLGFPDPDGSMQSTLHALSVRWYPVAARTWLPYLEVSAGWLTALDQPDHPDCSEGSGASGQLGLGLDWALSSWARLGGIVGARPFKMGRGCDDNYYPGKPPSPPHGGLGGSGQIAFTTVWSSR
jgi:hypothetical protein